MLSICVCVHTVNVYRGVYVYILICIYTHISMEFQLRSPSYKIMSQSLNLWNHTFSHLVNKGGNNISIREHLCLLKQTVREKINL